MAGRFEKPAAALGCGQQCVEPVGARLYAGPAAPPARIARLRAGRLAHAGAAGARLRHRSHADPAELLYLKLCRKLEKHGCARAPHEGPRAYRMRIAAAESALPPAMRAAATRFLELYETLRYAAPDERDRNEKHRRKATVSQLTLLLAECR